MYRLLIALLSTALLSAQAGAANKPTEHNMAFDMAIANEARLIKMLKESGRIPANASLAEAEQALSIILRERSRGAMEMAINTSETPSYQAPAGDPGKHSVFKRHGKSFKFPGSTSSVTPEEYDGPVLEARILSILMEFPDFPHNSILPGETDMFYADYTPEHYAGMLFNEDAYPGPSGETLITMNAYYQAQSGGSYQVTGTVAGWYMAAHPAAYYGANDPISDNDYDPQSLVAEALLAAQADPSINLADFDIEDRYDLDGDGNIWEPDGLIDHVQVFHSAIGEEAGGGALGADAIWSHRFNLGGIFPLTDTPTDVPYWGGVMAAYDYTIQPIDAAAGVVCHEYGHDLGLPDEYDTLYSGRGEPVSYWSLMSSGSWTGQLAGSQPTGFSPYDKEYLQQSLGGNWLTGETLHADDISRWGDLFLLDQASSKGTNNDAIRVDLPDKETLVVEPASGGYVYFSGSGDDLFQSMSTEVDLTGATTATFTFQANYDIETDWDYAYVVVDGTPIPGNITTNDDPNGQNFGNGITGASGGWVTAEFDLSAFSGAVTTVEIYYVTDAYVSNPGLYVDDLTITVDGDVVLADGAESDTSAFVLGGFTRDTGIAYSSHYYLLEWRTHSGVDEGLKYVGVGDYFMSSNEGLVVWYVDNFYDNNWVGLHPGNGFLGVVDADQHTLVWSDGYVASTRYQLRDAAFSLRPSPRLYVEINDPEAGSISLYDSFRWPIPFFKDWHDYSNPEIPDAGRAITEYGLSFKVIGGSWDGSVGKIYINRKTSAWK